MMSFPLINQIEETTEQIEVFIKLVCVPKMILAHYFRFLYFHGEWIRAFLNVSF